MPTFPNATGPAWAALNGTGLRQNTFEGGRDPGPGDDVNAGFERGSRWWHGVVEWVCVSAASGSADWKLATDAGVADLAVEALSEAESAAAVAGAADGKADDALTTAGVADEKATDALNWWTAWDQIAEVDPHRFGAVGFTYDQMVAANGAGMAAAAAANDAAFDAANTMLWLRGGGIIRYRGLIYPMAATKIRSSNVRAEGVGTGRYMPQQGSDKDFKGTIFLAYGTGPRVHTFPGITSGELNGGWRPDPDNGGQYFKLWSAYNSDATGTTPATIRQFSVLILDSLHDGAGGWSNITVLPWRGTNGVSDYLLSGAPVWGADWDFGYVIKNTEYVRSSNLNVSGPWREAAHAFFLTIYEGGQQYNRGEQNLVSNCQFEGRIGMLIRAPDVWKTTGVTASTVSIAWTDEQYWPSTGGNFRGSTGAAFTYTSTSLDGANLVFNGVSPNPTGIIHIRHGSSGLANSSYSQCMSYDLRVQNGSTAQSHGIASSCLEVSGNPLRGLKFINSKNHSRGSLIAHLHMTADQTMISHQFEGGGFLIASPEAPAQSWGPQATYETRGLRLVSSNGLSGDVDLRLFTPRNSLVDELQFSPRNDYSGNLVIQALRAGKNLIASIVSGGRWLVRTPGGNEAIGVSEAGLVEIRRTDGTVSVSAGASGHTSFYDAAGTEVFRVNSNGAVSIRAGQQFYMIGGPARINYDIGQFFTLREGTDTRLQVSATSIHSGANGVASIGSPSAQFTRAYVQHGVTVNGTNGASGTFTTADSKTITVAGGVITAIVG